MKKTLKLIAIMLVALCLLAGCGKSSDDSNNGTLEADYHLETTERPSDLAEGSSLAEILLAQFMENKDKTLEEIATALNSNEALVFAHDTYEVEGNWFAGFKEELAGYQSARAIVPMIGTIPFNMYVFETDDTAALMNTLNSLVDMRWNICTEADQMLMKAAGNYVFVVMAPWSTN